MQKKILPYCTIVSGLPRSGTSMMMRMLEAGGMDIITDHVRIPNEDNPNGYYELEAVKDIKSDTSWIDDAFGKAFKMTSLLLLDLPVDKDYQILFMKRNLSEVLASQERMLQRSGRQTDPDDKREMQILFQKHLRHIESWLSIQNNINVLYIDYNHVVSKPYANAERINRFLNGKLDVSKMAKVVNPNLYRQRR